MLLSVQSFCSVRHLVFFTGAVFSACGKPDLSVCRDTDALHAYAEFPVGVAVDAADLHLNDRYREIVNRQFNSITTDNAFKADHLHPGPLTFAWTEADRVAEYCLTSGKRLHGHTLIWHRQLPGWLPAFEGSAGEWDELLRVHVQTIVSHFKGKVTAWDVVNEAFNDDGTLRNSIWKEKIGATYIEKAFRYAHEADAEALLFYNDYDIAFNEKKRRAILGLLKNLKRRGVKVHGIGMQMHVSVQHPEGSQIAAALKDISDAGFLVHLSELDVSVNPLGDKKVPDDALLQRQADKYAEIIRIYKTVAPEKKYGITIWGIGDADSWIRTHFNRIDYPLLYDEDFNPKPAYCKLKEVL